MRSALLGLCLLPMLAQAAVYKCVGNDGAVSYSAVPCPATEGQATKMREAPPPSDVPPPPPPLVVSPPVSHEAAPAAPAASTPPPQRGARVTVVGDSAASDRDARVNEMRESAEREKKDSYDRDYELRRQRMELELRQQREREARQRQQNPAPSPNSSSSTIGEPSSTGTGQ